MGTTSESALTPHVLDFLRAEDDKQKQTLACPHCLGDVANIYLTETETETDQRPIETETERD